MPENNFEKQVQEKMGELHFDPSDAVWEGVEKQISGRKKRRALVFWWFFLFLAMGGGWLYRSGIFNHHQHLLPSAEKTQPTVSNGIHIEKPVASKIPDTATVHATHSLAGPAVAKRLPLKKTAAATKSTAPAFNSGLLKNPSPEKRPLQQPAIAGNNNSNSVYASPVSGAVKEGSGTGQGLHHIQVLTANERNSGIRKIKSTPVMDPDAFAKASTAVTETAEDGNSNGDQAVPGTTAMVTAFVFMLPTDTVSATGHPIPDSGTNIRPAYSAVVVKGTTPAAKIKKITWGISLAGGISGMANGFSPFSVSRNANSTFSTPVNNNANGGSVAPAAPTAATKGTSVGVDAFISKSVGRNARLLFGIGYHYYSSRQQAGQKIDTGNNVLQYRTGTSTAYTNQYHFIQLPVLLEKQLGSRSRFSVNGGLSLSFLAGSSALQYDDQQKIYVGSGNINKMQLGLLAGVHYRIVQKNIRIEMGPRINYMLSDLFDPNTSGTKHLFFAGIAVNLFFRKK